MYALDKRVQLLNSHVFKVLIYQFVFYGVFLVPYVFLVSLVVAFHLGLGHEFSVIEDWFVRQSWPLIILVKLCCLFFCPYNLDIQRGGVREQLSDQWPKVSIRSMAILITFYLFIFLAFSIEFSWQVDLVVLGLSFFGHILFFLPEFLYVWLIKKFFPLRRKTERFLMNLTLSVSSYLLSLLIFPYAQGLSVLHLVILTCLMFFTDLNHLSPGLLFIFLAVAPLHAFFNLDLLYEGEMSFFQISHPHRTLILSSMFLVCALFLSRESQYEETLTH